MGVTGCGAPSPWRHSGDRCDILGTLPIAEIWRIASGLFVGRFEGRIL